MGLLSPLDPTGKRRFLPVLALVTVLALLIAGVTMAIFNEHIYRDQKITEAEIQANILASTLTGALAFDDVVAAQEYVDALAAKPDVVEVGVYDAELGFVAGLRWPHAAEAPRQVATEPIVRDGGVTVTAVVAEDGQELGSVRLRVMIESFGRRILRYLGIALLIGMAAVVLGVLAFAQSALGRANAELRSRARDLAESNRQLQEQMEERARAEEALRHSQKMEAIGRLTGGVAHDFNNLLMVASSGLDLLDRTDDPARRDMLKAGVRQAVERGASLTRQLLAFSRRSALKPEVIDLAVQLDGMRVILEGALREDIQVRLALEPDLWPVEVDVSEFELALLNIAVNARDAMPRGGELVISAHNEPADPDTNGNLRDLVCLSVCDTGVGMAPEVMAQVFEPFFTTKVVGKGTGLGLSQVYGFARSSGGEATVESEPGKGCTITLCLPRCDAVPSAPALAPDEVGPSEPGSGRILLVEDDDVVAAMVTGMLAELGYTSRRAATASEALKALEAEPEVDLVFSDMVMPGQMDGRALAQAVRTHRPELPVLLTTGFSEAAAAARADGLLVLPKPYRIDALETALRTARDQARTA